MFGFNRAKCIALALQGVSGLQVVVALGISLPYDLALAHDREQARILYPDYFTTDRGFETTAFVAQHVTCISTSVYASIRFRV
jgi:hypothetical protein